jgi:hypothetical protein
MSGVTGSWPVHNRVFLSGLGLSQHGPPGPRRGLIP